MKHFLFFLLTIPFFCSCSVQCTPPENSNSRTTSFSAATWNLQEFFDAVTDGTEYKEFQSSAHWSKDKYTERLQRVCQVITEINADVYFFQEMENQEILYDIANQLAGNTWNSVKNWTYACFAKENGSAIGCAILSRFPLDNIKTHGIDIRTLNQQPSVRPLLQAELEVNGKTIQILCCHWKSKSGGEEETEIWRDWQEFTAANVIEDGGKYLLAGDFNRSAEDFSTDFSGNNSGNTYFRGIRNISLFNPWFYEDGSFVQESGSYSFDSLWKRIDNFFCTGNIKLTAFSTKTGPWADSEGFPEGYKIYTGKGYSDHLPVVCTVIM